MARILGSVAAVVSAAMFVGIGASMSVAGCAMSAQPDLTPAIDPGLPALDAASDPSPAISGGTSGDLDGGKPGPDGSKATATNPGDAAPTMPKPAPGEVLITEVMYTTFTPEPASEWFEVHSLGTVERSLSGLTIKDGSGRTQVIGAGVTIAPGAYVVLARSKAGAIAAKVPAGAIAYEYGAGLPDTAGILLTNAAAGGVSLLDGAAVITSAPYGGWFSQSGGSSVQLKVLDPSVASTKASWCLSLNPWTTGSEKGTPGAASDCP